MSAETKTDAAAAETVGSKIGTKLEGKPVIRVYLLDNSTKTLIIDTTTTAKDVCETMADKVGLRDPAEMAQYFGLYESKNGTLVDRPLAANEEVYSVISSWPEGAPSLLVFQVKLFMGSVITSDDPKVQQMLYLQAVHHVITGMYTLEPEEAVELAALQLQARLGDHNPESHRVGFLTARLREYIPAPLLRNTKKEPEEWERELLEAHAALSGSEVNPTKQYLQRVQQLESYGCAFFVAKQKQFTKLPKTILLGIGYKGIQILKAGRKAPYLNFKLSEIYRWGFKPNTNFYFEVKKMGGSGPVYEFETAEGNVISDLLTDYAMALLKELGISTDAAAEGAKERGPMTDERAATKIQSSFRGYRLRRDLEREYAAIRVQAVWRGYHERCKFDKMIAAMEAELAEDGAPPGM